MSLYRVSRSFNSHARGSRGSRVVLRRRYSSETASNKQQSPHSQFYSSMIPDMVPIAILGSAVYLGLRLLQADLSHERYLEEAIARVAELEAEVELLRAQNQTKTEQSVEVLSPHGEAKKRGWFW